MANMTVRNIPDNLPEVEFVHTDTEALVNKLIAGYEAVTGRTLYPADPVRAFILWLADVIIQERVLINESAKQNLPRYAQGKNLDSLCEIFHNTYRLGPAAATTMFRFHLATVLENDYIITDKLEVTVDGFVNFAITEHLIFKAGTDYADVPAVCTTKGEAGNDFLPGQVNKLISDEFLYFKSVENITKTEGGSDEETDTALYNRMRESEESYSTAGPRGSYIYHAKSVSSQISDVSAESPKPGIVDIRIIQYKGRLPDEELIERVREYLNADDIRPLTDTVMVAAPDIVNFNINMKYFISKEKEASTNEIRQAVAAAVDRYILWQTSKMGRDINPSYFNSVLMETGIKRAEITEPAFAPVRKGSVAVINEESITFGGVEDE